MSLPTLLDDRRHRGVELTPDGEHVRCRAPRGTLTPELRRVIGAHKGELLAGLEAEEAGAELDRIEAGLTERNGRLLGLYRAGDRAAAERLHADLRATVEADWMRARRRWARAEHALGRLDANWAFLLEDPDDEPEAVNGYRPAPDGRGWVETGARARRCVRHDDRPLAPDDPLYCPPCRAEIEAEAETTMTATARPAVPIRGDRECCPACGHLADDLSECGDERPVCADCRVALAVDVPDDTGGQR